MRTLRVLETRMPLAVGNNVQLLCHTLLSFRRDRRHFKPFAGPVAIPRDAARTAENAGSAVLSTSDSMHTTNTRPLQEQLRDQMELHKLQREGIPEDTRTQTSKTPSKGASGKTKRDVKTGSKVADRLPPARTKNARRRRYRGDVQSDGRFKAAFANSPDIGSDLAVQESAPAGLERKKQRTLTKQEDIALCSAIKVSSSSGLCLHPECHAACAFAQSLSLNLLLKKLIEHSNDRIYCYRVNCLAPACTHVICLQYHCLLPSPNIGTLLHALVQG